MRIWPIIGLTALFVLSYPALADETSVAANLLPLIFDDKSNDAHNWCSGDKCVDVVLIHGIYGTNSYDLNCALTSPVETDCYWQPLIDHLRAQPLVAKKIRIFVFRYMSDTANSTVDIGKALRTCIDPIPLDKVPCKELKRPSRQFIIVAHSMGGLVARQFMNFPEDRSAERGAEFVSGVITLATPHQGTPLANRVLRDKRVERLSGYNSLLCKVTKECLDIALLFDFGDIGFWWYKNHDMELATNADLPNRSDLLWDEHDALFAEERKIIPATQEVNVSLRHLEDSALADDSRKFILYGSSVDTTTVSIDSIEKFIRADLGHNSLKATAWMAVHFLDPYLLNDGLVPLVSAMKDGDNKVNLRREDLYDFDHLDMYGNSLGTDGNKKLDLFNRVTADIDALVGFKMIPPQLLRLDVSPAVVAAGTTATLSYRIRNGNGKSVPAKLKAIFSGSGNKTACVSVTKEIPVSIVQGSIDVTVTWSLQVPADFAAGPVSIAGEVVPVPDDGRDVCLNSPVLLGNPPPKITTSFNLTAADPFMPIPTISLALSRPEKQDYRIGETVQLKMTTTAGVAPFQMGGATTIATAFPHSFTIFLWVVRPDGSIRYYYVDSTNNLRESALPTPVSTPAPVVGRTWDLMSVTVDPLMQAGQYFWHAAIYNSEVFASPDQRASANPIGYRVLAERTPEPSVTGISTESHVYEPGDTMAINYSTWRGASTSAKYDLMLRVTAGGSGTTYYFYDDPSDATSRWLHPSIRPMQTLIPNDGEAHIPTAGMDPIIITKDTPSGPFEMKAYFSLPGKNTQVGESATWTFVMDTPAKPCFIATAAFGSPLNGSVVVLRRFRDRILLANSLGEHFVNLYYRYSPRLAAAISVRPLARKIVRTLLWPLVVLSSLWLATGFPAVLVICLATLLMIGWLIRHSPRFTMIALALAFAAGVLNAAEVRGSVVRSQPFPAPVVGAFITVSNSSLQTATGPDGTFRIQNLPAGTYQVQAAAPGFQSASVQATLSSATAIQNIVLAVTPTGARTYEYYLAHTAETAGWWTVFALTNAGYTGADVSFAAFDAAGQYLGTSTKLTRIEINQQFGGSPSSFFAAGMAAKAAWYKITSSAPLAGIEMFGLTGGTFAALPLTMASSQSLFFPHVAVDSQWWTGISVVSGWVRASNVAMEVRDGVGTTLAAASRIGVMKPGEKTVDQLQNYFGWDYPRASQWVSVRADGPITGFELFGTQDFKMMAAVPGTGSGARRLFLPHIATTSGWWTGVAMLNVGTTNAIVKLTAYGADGANLAVGNALSLSPGQRTVNQIQNYFDRWPANVKYVELNSDSDLIAFELVGNSAMPAMSGMAAFTSAGAELVFPFVESDSGWETTLQVANVSPATAQVTLDAYDSKGSKLAEIIVSLPARAVREGTLKTLFGRALPDARSVRVRSSAGTLAGYSSLARLNIAGFADFPAQLVSQTNGVGSSTSAVSSIANFSRLVDAVKLDPDPAGGVRIVWSSEVDPLVRELTGGQVQSGDIVVEVNGIKVNSLLDLWTAYRQNREKAVSPVQVRRGGGQPIGIEVRNTSKVIAK